MTQGRFLQVTQEDTQLLQEQRRLVGGQHVSRIEIPQPGQASLRVPYSSLLAVGANDG